MGFDWVKIREEYENGNTDPDNLAGIFGCSSVEIKKRAKKEKWENSLETGRRKRIRILKAVQDVALKGIEKADSMLDECGNMKDLETHSKTLKAYRDVGLTKPEEIMGTVKTNNALDDLYDISFEDAARVTEDDED
ncbi:hypothetical protein EP073_12215 [Geovibrio thiophilus]|uniref:Uncharacterized protein n=1 Tax=Geovibrio thiophilus TaxID=139438 RepID=A0A410K136_9BACT|nr:hypothetical protein [Geovibrio thiophilus]QAR34140.1 hypothetical protein EP073_12215 [Geovibrio thiophilus]